MDATLTQEYSVMNDQVSTNTEAKKGKSIVPAKYAGRYKDGGSDALATFIKEQCLTKEGFDYANFFTLCRVNGIPEEQVAKYESQVAEAKLGSQGRARMTLRNMLATIARKDGKLADLEGHVVNIELSKPALSGAAKVAKDKQETAGEATTQGNF